MIKALMYHDIRDLEETKYPDRLSLKSFMRVKDFIEQIDYLKRNFNIIDPKDINNSLNSNKAHAVLTFDDGLYDHIRVAEILQKKKLTGTFFIPTEAIMERKMLLSHKIQFILAAGNEKETVSKILEHLSDNKSEQNIIWEKNCIPFTMVNTWSKEMIFITKILRTHGRGKEIANLLFKRMVSSDEIDFCDGFYLNQAQIIQMKDMGMTIGGHGHISEALTDIDQIADIKKCRINLNKIGVESYTFSYPNGKYNDSTLLEAAQNGFTHGFTTVKSNVINDRFIEIPRFDAAIDL
jgi:peptidoglycan/xylan/chitin deacetylase (PgdA/CDA1 family)